MSVAALTGGITAPLGFRASGVAAGIKASGALDVALIAPDGPAAAAALFTTNQVQAAPVQVSRAHLATSGGIVRAVVVNSGCANACTGTEGLETARAMAATVASDLGCAVDQVLVASTGVIGVHLDRGRVLAGCRAAVSALSRDGEGAARGIMTTDLAPKESAIRVETPAGAFHVGGIAKGAGMIEPMLATMLAFLTTDAHVSPPVLQRALSEVADRTFNAITVDGECSTNDMLAALASGGSGVHIDDASYGALVSGLEAVARALALAIVRGGEGATKLVAITVTGGETREAAVRAAKTIANSPLVKTAVHGADPNWAVCRGGRRSGARFAVERAAVESRWRDTLPQRASRTTTRRPGRAASAAGRDRYHCRSRDGWHWQATVWTCDLSAEYVRINGEYRT